MLGDAIGSKKVGICLMITKSENITKLAGKVTGSKMLQNCSILWQVAHSDENLLGVDHPCKLLSLFIFSGFKFMHGENQFHSWELKSVVGTLLIN